MNKVVYGSYTFQDADLTLINGGAATLYWSPLGDELRASSFRIPVQFVPRTWQKPADDFKAEFVFGTPVDIYQDNTLLFRFYLTDITGGQRKSDGSYIFELVGTDFPGLFTSVQHLGGMYEAATAGNVIAEILGAQKTAEGGGVITYETSFGIEYTVDEDIAGERIDGLLLPTSDARENLRSVLQLIGAAPQMAADGTPHFADVDPGAGISVSGYEIYAGDAYEQNAPVTGVQVVEYSYIQGDDTPEELIFDASDVSVNSAVITFDKPFFDLRADGLTKEGEGATYAIVSGLGQLFGKPYTIAQRVVSAGTGLSGAENVKTIDNPLCTSLYSSTLLQRMSRYFSNAGIVRNAMAMPQHYTPGKLINYPDPMNEEKQGYPIEMALTFSGITKSDQRITADWTPGDATPFTQSQVLTSSGTFTVPEGVTRLRLILIGGGKGGWGGYKGEAAAAYPATDSGDGGQPGEGGDGALILQVDIELDDIAASYSIVIGQGGAGGAIDHGEGSDGTPTTATGGGKTFSSANGVRYSLGLLDIFSGIVYAKQGQTGIYAGGPGEDAARSEWSMNDALTSQTGTVTTWSQGQGYLNGRGGGGPAYGANGNNYPNASSPSPPAGFGADAALDGFNGYTAPIPTIQGTGGLGGNGGGGGGRWSIVADNGGHGSIGAAGAAGIFIAYMAFGAPPTPVDDHYLLDSNGQQLLDSNYEKLKEAAS